MPLLTPVEAPTIPLWAVPVGQSVLYDPDSLELSPGLGIPTLRLKALRDDCVLCCSPNVDIYVIVGIQ